MDGGPMQETPRACGQLGQARTPAYGDALRSLRASEFECEALRSALIDKEREIVTLSSKLDKIKSYAKGISPILHSRSSLPLHIDAILSILSE